VAQIDYVQNRTAAAGEQGPGENRDSWDSRKSSAARATRTEHAATAEGGKKTGKETRKETVLEFIDEKDDKGAPIIDTCAALSRRSQLALFSRSVPVTPDAPTSEPLRRLAIPPLATFVE
jgi:hypothetical protein